MNDLYADAGRPGVLIVGAPHDLGDLTELVRAARGRVLAAHGWADIADMPPVDSARLLLVSTVDVAEAILADALPGLTREAADGDVAMVICLDHAQIDLVASMAFGPQVDLLCRPTSAELAASIALGLIRRGALLADTVREREAERLRRLNEEVARIADVLARLSSAADRKPGAIADRTLDYRAPPVAAPSVNAIDVRKAIRARRLRDQQFPDMFEDPAWDMLLDLYAADLEGTQVSVSSLCIAAAVPATTALRWIARMTDAGLLERQPDPFDRRRAFMALSEEGRARMQRYFATLTQNGLQIA